MLYVGCYYQIWVIEYTLCNIKHIKGPEGSKKRREAQNEKELEKIYFYAVSVNNDFYINNSK